jgi:formate dehydrogenase (coenzyme F420) beta subunit
MEKPMARMARIEVRERNPIGSLQAFLKLMLESGELDGLMVAQHLPGGTAVMPTLVTDPQKLGEADPLAPAFPLNAAKVVSRLSRKRTDSRIGVVLRPCEIRAFVELVKLKQVTVENLVLIGFDCPGALRNKDYREFVKESGQNSTLGFCKEALSGDFPESRGFHISPACLSCDHPVPEGSDLTIGLLGMDIEESLLLIANSPKGDSLLDSLKLPSTQEPPERGKAIEKLVSRRSAHREIMLRKTAEATSDMEKLAGYLSHCVNCYNCRVACPVCYCKECVFVTDVFEHEPSQYLKWARRKGIIKMPVETIFYHLTRLAHMSTACVGCGQCSNACPNDIPVMELFQTIGSHTQKAFGYQPGLSFDTPPPLSVFREEEFTEVTGGR